MNRIKVDQVDFREDIVGIYVVGIKDGEEVRGAVVQGEFEVMKYINENFILPK